MLCDVATPMPTAVAPQPCSPTPQVNNLGDAIDDSQLAPQTQPKNVGSSLMSPSRVSVDVGLTTLSALALVTGILLFYVLKRLR